MNVIGISGLSNSVAFKQRKMPGLSKREYQIAQGFDAAAALVGSTGIIAAAAEERFTGEKATGAFPVNAIGYCLETARLIHREIDLIAHGFSYEPFKGLFDGEEYLESQYREVFSPEAQRELLRRHFGETDWSEKLVCVPHHLAHAASAFYPSGFEEALILVTDGMGEAHSATVAVGKGTDIRVLAQIPAFHSIGTFYGVFTLYLGFCMNSDEYKVMGLAPYGNPGRFYDRMMQWVKLKDDGTYAIPLFARNSTLRERETHAGVLRYLAEQLGPAREPEAEVIQFHQDIAAALQAVLQTCQLHVLKHFQVSTGQRNLCLAGGVALNCSANGAIQRSGLFNRVFVQPAAGDDGTAVGAALYAQKLYDPGFKPHKMTVPLWGPEFSDAELHRAVAGRSDCRMEELDSMEAVCQEVAARIEKGQIVAWFQGRMEFGPRALGNRSILADPRGPGMRDRINSLVKKREAFRPFAPVVAVEAATRFFDLAAGDEDTYASMLLVTPVRPEFRDRLPAVTHVDGSARIQTVARGQNPRLWQLLNAFEVKAGIPVLLNTSFNVRGQPIVRTPQEAVETFLFAHLDLLVMGNMLITRVPDPAELDDSAGGRPPLFDKRGGTDASAPLAAGCGQIACPKLYPERIEQSRCQELISKCIHEFVSAQAAKTPEAVAAVFEDQQLTFAELDARANQLARYLQRKGVGPETLVGICLEVSLEMLIGLLGVLKAGGAYVPLDPDYPQDRLAFMIDDSRMQVLLTQERLLGLLPAHAAAISNSKLEVVCLDAQGKALAQEGSHVPVSGVTSENLAYVIYTSGSTGKPKGVMVTHDNVANFFTGMDERIGADPPGVWLALTSISFDISVLELFWTLARGFKVVLHRTQPRASRRTARLAASPSRAMDFSLFYFASDEPATDANKYRLLLEGARYADEHGFTAVWTPERHLHAFGGLYPNPSVTSAALAAITRRVQIRAGSVVLPLHHPIRVAEEWAVVDNLSNGRVALSIASGWQVNDFVLAPEHYADRKQIMLRHLDTLRKLWRGETVGFRGSNGQDVPVRLSPRPIQAELPLWLTASGNPDTFVLAGEMGCNVLTHLLGQSTAELAKKIEAYRAAWHQHGHAGEGQVTLMLHTFVGDDLQTVREKVRSPFTAYLRSSIDLIKNAPSSFSAFKRPVGAGSENGQAEPNGFTEEEIDVMARHAFERYFETSGLFGPPQRCVETVERLRRLGVDEIACLIDFGLDTESVLAGLDGLNRVRQKANESPKRSDSSLAAQVVRHRVTHLQCTPSLAGLMAEDPRSLQALQSLHTLMLGGEALPPDLVQRLTGPARILNMYGPTETTVWSTTYTVMNGQKTIPIGRPIANTEIYIVDENLKAVASGEPGELLLGGSGVARGYLYRPELTMEKFIPHLFQPHSAARLYRTGDLVRCHPDGNLEYLGRMDQQVKLRGFRIELGEIEATLRLHPEVKDCVAVIREDQPGDKRLVAYLVARSATATGHRILRDFLARRLPDYMVPAAFVEMAALPLTPNGKLDRKALPAPEYKTHSVECSGTSSPFGRNRPMDRNAALHSGPQKPAHDQAPEKPQRNSMRPGPEPRVPGQVPESAALERVSVPARSLEALSAKSQSAPATTIEARVSRIWREVLGLEEAAQEDNFFEFGGNSLLATRLMSRLRREFGCDLPLRLGFDCPTIQELSHAVSAEVGPGNGTSSLNPQVIARRKNTAEAPLSFSQQRLWFLAWIEPGPHYNEHFDLRLTGPLDVPALEQAFNEIIRRHETLRSTFEQIDGTPFQRIKPALTITMPVLNLSNRPAAEAEAIRLAVEQSQGTFQLDQGPLFRARLLRLSDREHILALTLHHIIIDGWSRGVLLNELAALYPAFRRREPSLLPELPIQYADFAAWQRQGLRDEAMRDHLAYWLKQLRGAPPLLELPSDLPRPEIQSYRGARLPLRVNEATLRQISALGRQEGCTVFMVLLAAFQALLARYTGGDDIVVGSPVAGRNHAETEGLIGFFLNPLVLRGDLSGDPTFVELLRRTRQMALDAYAHQDLPFEKLVSELHPVRDLGFSPLFQVMLVFQNLAARSVHAGDLTITSIDNDAGISKLDLTLHLEETPRGCSGWVEYATDLFEPLTIARLMADFQALLENALAQPNDRLSQFPTEPRYPSRARRNGDSEPPEPSDPGQGRGATASRGSLLAIRRSTEPASSFGHPLEPPRGSSAVPYSTGCLDVRPAPRSEVVQRLARIWSEVLGIEKIDLHDNLFDLGAHSLLVFKIAVRINNAFKVEVPFQSFLETPTLGAIACIIEIGLRHADLMAAKVPADAFVPGFTPEGFQETAASVSCGLRSRRHQLRKVFVEMVSGIVCRFARRPKSAPEVLLPDGNAAAEKPPPAHIATNALRFEKQHN
ncbi:MAG TPA: MupA/Atu3671 family FMN-dependent luciferase-like monooxygenase [Candidatus Acidoferrum sp.]|jgi:natural product biosynthesis luciferase-like monooxygenase protein|nr:MupA/Atu3671 family FMN-dependent luciferase-like monooxygenase [Candidatus Acidoferrum sp.]